MDITKQAFKAVDKYFKVLSETGQVPKDTSRKLMTLVFIEELLNGEMSKFITDSDKESIKKALYCVSDNCIINNIVLDDTSCQNIMSESISSNNCPVSTNG